jgi:hypothetical protein
MSSDGRDTSPDQGHAVRDDPHTPITVTLLMSKGAIRRRAQRRDMRSMRSWSEAASENPRTVITTAPVNHRVDSRHGRHMPNMAADPGPRQVVTVRTTQASNERTSRFFGCEAGVKDAIDDLDRLGVPVGA